MKKTVFAILMVLISLSVSAQAPHAFKYQAVIRDKAGEVLSSQNVNLRVSILQSAVDGPEVYREMHSVTTSELGLANIEIGKGKDSTGALSNVDWGSGSHFLKIEMDLQGGSDYELMGVSQLLSVPYALYAEKSGSGTREVDLDWEVSGSNVFTGHGGSFPSGNVGIGNNAPGSLLYVGKNTGEPTITIRNMGGGGGATYSMIDDLSGANWKFKATAFGGFKIRDQANTMDVLTIEPNSAANAVYIDTAGNVGIGTTEPDNKLDVNGDLKAKSLVLTDSNGIVWNFLVNPLGQLIGYPNPPGDIGCGTTVTDSRDGKQYPVVQIGLQCWVAANMNIGIRIDGNVAQSDNELIEKYCYNNAEDSCDVYGGLYQWNEAMQYSLAEGVQGVCPEGWHIPTDYEYKVLVGYLIGEDVAGGKMKETGTVEGGNGHWKSPNRGATNESGFSGLPGGNRHYGSGSFDILGYYGYFWSSSQYSATSAWGRSLNYGYANVDRSHSYKDYGFSVRCLKDTLAP